MYLGYPVIDLHTHLRNDIPGHTKIARQSGISAVVYMANTDPPLCTLARIKASLAVRRHCIALPISAITRNLAGKELVAVDKIKPYVVGFSDDGQYLADLDLLAAILANGVLVLAHCSPAYEIGVQNPHLETEYIQRYLGVLGETGGKLHIQHVSRKQSIEVIRRAKAGGLPVTCETCPHYFTYTQEDLEVKVNPPLGTTEDLVAIRQGLADNTIDVIASDYAPAPRKTGIAGFRSLFPLSWGLVLEGVLSEKQLKEKLFDNPQKIIKSGGYRWRGRGGIQDSQIAAQ